MKRLDCCVAIQNIKVKNWCVDALLSSWSGCALYVWQGLAAVTCWQLLGATDESWMAGVDRKWTNNSWRGAQQEGLPPTWHRQHPKVMIWLAWKDAAVGVKISVLKWLARAKVRIQLLLRWDLWNFVQRYCHYCSHSLLAAVHICGSFAPGVWQQTKLLLMLVAVSVFIPGQHISTL